MEATHKISACYFPGSKEAEITYDDLINNTHVGLTFKISHEDGMKLAEVVPACIYFGATGEPSPTPLPANVWQPIETAPKDGNEFLVCYPRCGNVMQLVSWNKIYKHFQSKGKAEFLHPGDIWAHIPSLDADQKPGVVLTELEAALILNWLDGCDLGGNLTLSELRDRLRASSGEREGKRGG